MTCSPIATTPVPITVKITKVNIPVDPDISIRGVSLKNSNPIQAEWVDYHDTNPRGPSERVILFIHGGLIYIKP